MTMFSRMGFSHSGFCSFMYLWPMSRLSTTRPFNSTSSPTLSWRAWASVMGVVSLIMATSEAQSIEGNFAGAGDLQHHPAAAPAHVADAHVEAGGVPEHLLGVDAESGGIAAIAHGPDAEGVEVVRDLLLEGVHGRIGVPGAELAQEQFLALLVAGDTVAADGHAENAGAAALALGLHHGINDALAYALDVATGADGDVRQAVLGPHV